MSALAVDALTLTAIAGRITEFGFTPNRVAALERWQTSYLPIYAAWAATVVIVFPPLFAFA